jgi:hypothetical protein
VKFYAKTGKEMVITLTTEQIQKQLKAIEDYKSGSRPPVRFPGGNEKF